MTPEHKQAHAARMLAHLETTIPRPAWVATEFVYPPIPSRQFDWSAIDERSYGGDPRDPIGTGATEQEAIADLMEQLGVVLA